jgi:prohibitin 1
MRVLSRPVTEKLPVIYTKLGLDYDERVLPSIGNEVLKAIIAQYDAESLLTLRDKVSKEIRDSMNQRASEFNIRLDDVSITHLQFSNEFASAIEKKQVAQQDAERFKYVVMKSEQERLAAIIKANSEADAAELVSKVR